MLYLTYRSIEIFYYELAKSQAYQADINIHPDLNGFGIFEDGKGEILYQAGRNAALKEIQQIKSKLQALNIPLKH
jgi:NTE family protein